MSGDPEQEYFSDGITEDIITDLSKVSALSVIARNTSFHFQRQARYMCKDVASRARTSGSCWKGACARPASRVRITAQLINGKDGRHVWAERYDRDLEDIFALQDEISKNIVDALKVRLLAKELETITKRPNRQHGGLSNLSDGTIVLQPRTRNEKHEGGPASVRQGDRGRSALCARLCRAGRLRLLSPARQRSDRHIRKRHRQCRPGIGTRARSLPMRMHRAALQCSPRALRDEAEAEFEKALELDPTSFEANYFYGRNCHAQGQFERARGLLRAHDRLEAG